MNSLNYSKIRNYYIRQARIDKNKNQDLGYKIQVYNNDIIDRFILNFYNETGIEITPELLFNELWSLNQPFVFENYLKILSSPYIDDTFLNQVLVRTLADKRLNTVVTAEVERISKNLDYMNEVLQTHEVNLEEYGKIARRESKIANRKNILERSTRYTNAALTSYGINIQPNVFTYRDLDITSEALNRQTQMMSDFDRADAVNKQARRKNLPDVYTQKKWVWTGKGKTTRHRSNDGQVVGMYDYFNIINDNTGRVDSMMYPHDPNASFENAWICYCKCVYF